MDLKLFYCDVAKCLRRTSSFYEKRIDSLKTKKLKQNIFKSMGIYGFWSRFLRTFLNTGRAQEDFHIVFNNSHFRNRFIIV